MRVILMWLCVVAAGCATPPATPKPKPAPVAKSEVVCPARDPPRNPKDIPLPEGFKEKYPGGSHQRTLEALTEVFRKNISGFYTKYNRALRLDPCLANGAMAFALAINPDGSVAAVELIYSNLNAPKLESEFVALIYQLQFGSADGSGFFTLSYPFRLFSAPR